MSLLDKFGAYAELRDELLRHGTLPFGVVTDQILSPTEGIVRGKRTILAGTNNYLGLTFDADAIAAGQAALASEGTGTTGSRMANGTYAGHLALEQEIARFFDRRHALVFTTGFSATMGMVGALAGRDDVLLIDADCHASIYDGCRLSGAEILRFRHNDVADLEKRLRRLGERARNTLVVTEGLYSMLGDQAPLEAMVDLKDRYGACMLLDEAHSMGVFGERGRGLAEAVGVEDRVDFVVGTFSKSLGSIGGFCVSNRPELELARFAARSYIFTASPTPSIVASTRVTLQRVAAGQALRKQLWENSRRLYQGLSDAGFRLGPEPGPVVAVFVDCQETAINWWHQLLDDGVYVNLVMPPATPSTSCLLRCSISAAHTPDQVNRIIDRFSALLAAPQAASTGS